MSLLKVENLKVEIGNKALFSDLALEVGSNEIVAIVGPSGIGKSTFLTCLNRLIDFEAGLNASGSIHFRDRDASLLDPIELRRCIGMVFQAPNPFPVSIYKNLEIPLKEHRVGNKHTRPQIIEEVLVRVGLWDEVKDRLYTSALRLSGGQQQRLCIARALTLNPSVLLLDEPCSALDPVATERIEKLMLELKESISLVVVTHNLAQAKRIADRTAFLWKDEKPTRFIEVGNTKEIFDRPSSPISERFFSGLTG